MFVQFCDGNYEIVLFFVILMQVIILGGSSGFDSADCPPT